MSDHARKAVEIMERAEAERREALRNDPDDEPAAAPVPDGARAEYERLKRLLSTVRTGEDLADAEAGMDAIVLPLLSQPAASEWYEHAADVLAGWFKRYIGQEAPDGEVLASATDRLLCSQPAAQEDALRAALAPFAHFCEMYDGQVRGLASRDGDEVYGFDGPKGIGVITLGDLRRARAALADTEAGNE